MARGAAPATPPESLHVRVEAWIEVLDSCAALGELRSRPVALDRDFDGECAQLSTRAHQCAQVCMRHRQAVQQTACNTRLSARPLHKSRLGLALASWEGGFWCSGGVTGTKFTTADGEPSSKVSAACAWQGPRARTGTQYKSELRASVRYGR